MLRCPHLFAWALDRPVMLAIAAHQAASGADMVEGLMKLTRSGVAARIVHQEGGVTDWLPFYQDQAAVIEAVRKHLWPDQSAETLMKAIDRISQLADRPKLDAMNLLERAPEAMRQPLLVQFNRLHGKMFREHFRQLESEFDGGETFPEVDVEAVIHLPAIQFIVLVAIPCVFEYGQTPFKLFESAQEGDPQALDKLLRVDKSVLSDPVIGAKAKQLGMQRDIGATLLAEAFVGGPDTPIRRGAIKARLAASIINLARMYNEKLQPVDVRALFDAAAQDRTGDEHAIDPDLPAGDEAWRQAVHRAKPFWGIEFLRDKEPEHICHGGLMREVVRSVVYEPDPDPDFLSGLLQGADAATPHRPGAGRESSPWFNPHFSPDLKKVGPCCSNGVVISS